MWEQIIINDNNVSVELENGYIIKMPKQGRYPKYQFFVSAKLVKRLNKHQLIMSFKKNWTFDLRQYGAGQYNSKDIINQKEIQAEMLQNEFIKIVEQKKKERIIPVLEAGDVEIIDDLIDD